MMTRLRNPLITFLEKNDGHLTSQYIVTFCACICQFSSGLSFSWIIPSLNKVMSDEYPFKMSSDEASYLAIINQIGFVVGAVLSAHLMDVIGRKWTLVWTSLPMVASFLMISLSDFSKILLYVARVLGGIAEASATGIVGIYIAEIASPSIRGMLVNSINIAYMISYILMSLYGYYLSIQVTALVSLAFPILFLLTFTSMPESPYYLLMKKNTEEARRSLRLLRRRQDVELEACSLQADVDRQMSERGGYRQLFTIPANRRAICLMMCVKFLHLGTGFNAIGAYAQVLLDQERISAVWGMFIIGVFTLLSYIGGNFLLDRLGRQKLAVISSTTTTVCLFGISAFFLLRFYLHLDLSNLTWLLLVLIVCYFICYSGMATVINVFATELFSNSVKAEGTCLFMVIHGLGTMATTKYYQFTSDHVALFVPFVTFGLITLFGIFFFVFVMPETKGKTLEAIQVELKNKK
uniref:Putative sugar transporter n=1 Tax=Phaedon cochleariae TaxID=80249 RepID=W4VSK0_PHACE